MSKKAIEVAARYRRKYWREVDVENFEKYRVKGFDFPKYPIITNNEEIQSYNWGLISHKVKSEQQANTIKKKTLNAKSETVFEKFSFSTPIISKRCIVPSTGFFEWRHEEKKRIPYYIQVKDSEIFSLAGIYDEWVNNETGEITNTFSILTTTANTLMEYIHNTKKRMPVILSPETEENWLNPNLSKIEINSFLKPFDADRMNAYTINNDFLKKRATDPSIIEKYSENRELLLFP